MKTINNKIKLVIWDLDDTFWQGTLAEESVAPIEYNIRLIKALTNRGIVNSICSKNDFDVVRTQIKSLGVWDYFVFPQISWKPKGQVIRDLLEKMALRPDNALFIDDNPMNLNEALFYSPNLNVSLPEHIPSLIDSPYLEGKDDPEHSRLEQYKNLERRQIEFAESKVSNIEFLKQSNISVSIKHNCLDHLPRIHELVERTNQLNFTKNRVSIEELKSQLSDPEVSAGYVHVVDKYGDYGIAGFYAVIRGRLEHFLFSCRTLNMYIDSYVYRQIGRPTLVANGDVASAIDTEMDLSFINAADSDLSVANSRQINGRPRVLMMGGCDLDQVAFYLRYRDLVTEFNHPNALNINVHKDNTHLIRQFKSPKPEYLELVDRLAVLDRSDVNLKINAENWDVLVFSPLNDYSRGLYRHRKSGFLLPFDAFNINWTEEANWMQKPTHLETLPVSFLRLLKEEFDFLGPISPDDFGSNVEWMLNVYHDKKIIFLNGSEVKLDSPNYWEQNMHQRHALMNSALFDACSNKPGVRIIDVRKFVTSPADVTDNIRHYRRGVYKQISDEIIAVSREWLHTPVKARSKVQIAYEKIEGRIISGLKRVYRGCFR